MSVLEPYKFNDIPPELKDWIARFVNRYNRDVHPPQNATAVTASGSSVSFTGIPDWVTWVAVFLYGISTNGTEDIGLRLNGETTGYLGSEASLTNAAAVVADNATTRFLIVDDNGAAGVRHGAVLLYRFDRTSNVWIGNWGIASSNNTRTYTGGGSKSLTAQLASLEVFMNTDTYDAGQFGLLYG